MKKVVVNGFVYALLVSSFMVSCANDENNEVENKDDKEVVRKEEQPKAYDDPDIFSAEQHSRRDIVLAPGQEEIGKALNTFGWKVFSKVFESRKADEPSVLFSSLSLTENLLMMANGVVGETSAELKQAMGVAEKEDRELNEYVSVLNQGLEAADSRTKFYTNNSLWYRDDNVLHPSFEDKLQRYFAAETFPAKMEEATIDSINMWVKDKTHGRLEKVLDYDAKYSMSVLLNTVYFRGLWHDKIGDGYVNEGTFTNENGIRESAVMINTNSKRSYFQNDELEAVLLPFGNSAFSMCFILPREGVEAKAALESLIASSPAQNGLFRGAEVDLTFPRFRSSAKFMLRDVMKRMGVEGIFERGEDFAYFTTPSASIDDIEQHVVLGVDERGAEAAAATVSRMFTDSGVEYEKHTVVLNRPFFYSIIEYSTSTPLFIGYQGSVAK